MKSHVRAAALALAAAALAPGIALAHEVLHAVERSGRAVAVRAWEDDGEPLAGARYEVYAPSEASPWQAGQVDRNGWLAFVPDRPGPWRVKVVEDAGHGFEIAVEGAAAAGAAPPDGRPSLAALLVRPLAGAAAIAAVFAVLFLAYRRRPRA
jgi:nickel transport protein